MHGEEAMSKAEITTTSKERRAELSPAAQRALAEAEARRREAAQRPEPPEEIASDF
jgi:hypothetical protein